MATKALASKTGQVKYLQKGEPGAQGPAGPLIYPAGEYGASVSYTRTSLSAPMVLCEGQYYVLNKEGTFKNINPKNDYAANGSRATWVLMDKMKYAFAEVLMANFAKLASAVFYGQYMFSQYGIDNDGNPSSDYRNFEKGTFFPNLMFDFLRGNGVFSGFVKKVITIINQDNFYDYFEYISQWQGYVPYSDRLASYVELVWIPSDTYIALPHIYSARVLWPNEILQSARANVGNAFIINNKCGKAITVRGCANSSDEILSNGIALNSGEVLHAKCTAMVYENLESVAWSYIKVKSMG